MWFINLSNTSLFENWKHVYLIFPNYVIVWIMYNNIFHNILFINPTLSHNKCIQIKLELFDESLLFLGIFLFIINEIFWLNSCHSWLIYYCLIGMGMYMWIEIHSRFSDLYQFPRKISTQELLRNLKDIFLGHYMNSNLHIIYTSASFM